MRNNIISSAAVAASAILLTLSCTKQEEMQSVNKGKTFIATIEQAQTKTTLEDNGDGKYFVNWNSGDLININAQAALGGNVRISTIDGDVLYEVKPGTPTDTRIRLRGKGVPSVRDKNTRGDHYVTLVVQVPTKLTSEQKDLLKAFDESYSGKNPDDGTSGEKKKKGFFR